MAFSRTGELIEIHCRGCGRQMGYGNGKPMHKLTCSTFCSHDEPFSENEERDSVIEMLARTQGWTATRVAVNFEITRQRAQQILSERGVA